MVIYFNAFYEPSRLADHVLTSDLLSAFAARDMALFPPLNISENTETVTIRALIPGATLKDVDLSLCGQILGLKGELSPVKGSYSLQERPVGRFQRRVNLGFEPKQADISATMARGVLTISIKKTNDDTKRRIPIIQSGEGL